VTVVESTLGPTDPPQRTTQEAAAADALTDAAITDAAQADPDNPPLTAEDRIAVARRRVERVRTDLGLSRDAFAARYGLPVGTSRQ
jgi:putative transcriptional regulator